MNNNILFGSTWSSFGFREVGFIENGSIAFCLMTPLPVLGTVPTGWRVPPPKKGSSCSKFWMLPCYRDVNTTIMELLIMVYACKTSCAKSIIGVVPYFPYSKQCKMRKRGSIVSKLLASMMCKAGRCGELLGAARGQLSSGPPGRGGFGAPPSIATCGWGVRLAQLPIVSLLPSQRPHPPDHHGSAPEGDPGLFQRPCGQLAGISVFAAVHPGRGEPRLGLLLLLARGLVYGGESKAGAGGGTVCLLEEEWGVNATAKRVDAFAWGILPLFVLAALSFC